MLRTHLSVRLGDWDIDKTEGSPCHPVTPSPCLSLTRVVAPRHPVTPSPRHSS